MVGTPEKINWGNSRSPRNSYSGLISFFYTYSCVVVSEYILEDFCGVKIIYFLLHIICLSFMYYFCFYQQIDDVSIDSITDHLKNQSF